MESQRERLVVRVNELFHDFTNQDYEKITYSEMLIKEKERWDRTKKFFDNKNPLRILDIGTGTGFVPLVIGKFLKASDEFICTDVSRNMLNLTREKLKREKFKFTFKFLKLDNSIRLKRNSIDIITVNSVLHHIPNTKSFLKEIDGILKKNGILIIGHEPNIRFSRNKLLNYNNHILGFILKPKEEIKYVSVRLGIYEILDRMFGLVNAKRKKIVKDREKLAKNINKILKSEGLITEDLLIGDIMSLVDYKTMGFDPKNLMEGYEILHLESYHHLRGFEYGNINFLKRYSENLKKKFPLDGRTFFAIYKKSN